MNMALKNKLVLSENQKHQCQDIQGFCIKIGCDSYFCKLCQKKTHSKHKKYCKCLQDIKQLLINKLNENYQLILDFEFLQQKVKRINLFFQNEIEKQQLEINQILQLIRDYKFNEILNKTHTIRYIYHNDDKDIITKIINVELKQYIKQITDFEMQWSQIVQQLMSQKEKTQKIQFISDESDLTSSSSEEKEEIIKKDAEGQQQGDNNFKIKQFSLIENLDSNEQNNSEKVQEQKVVDYQKDDELRNNQLQLQQLQENILDDDYTWKLVLSENLFEEALALKSQQKINEAIQKVNESLQYFPNNLEALKLKGHILFQQDKYLEVIEISDQVIKQEKRAFDSYTLKCQSLINLSRFHEAIVCLDESISAGVIQPQQDHVYLQKAISLQGLKKFEQAIDCAKKVSHNQKSLKFYSLQVIGESLYYLKKYDEALEYVTKALELDQTHFELNKMHSFILIHLKQYEAALKSLDVLSDFHQWQTILLQSSILRLLKRFDEALQKCQQALNINPHEMLIIKEKNLIQTRNIDDKTILSYLNL